ncbi:MAG: aldose epimerase family protein [Rhizobiaceae bacterium]
MSIGTDFGRTPSGEAVHRYTISGGGLTANILNWGAVIQDLRLGGHGPSLVLGFEAFDSYPAHSRYFGATAGRCANRIRDGRFEIDGKSHQVDRNFLGKHHLHGGSASIGKRLWTVGKVDAERISLSIRVEDGEMGYPGRLEISQTIGLLESGVLDIVMEAQCDAPTLCNLAHHSYFNLGRTPDILDHTLRVAADHYLPVDAEMIPTGEVRPVAGTPFDLRTARRLGDVSANHPIDHNFCISRERTALRAVGELRAPASGVSMLVRTSEPGLQVYDGSQLDVPVPGIGGRMMKAHAGIAMEPQVWPDAVNHGDWFQPLLRPNETYRQHTQYVFAKELPA